MPPESKKKFEILYQEAEGKRSFPASGAWGGPSPDGSSVYVHFYTEFGTVPSAMSHAIRANGEVDLSKGEPVKAADVTREVQATVMLSPEAALSIGRFLIEKATYALKQRPRTTVQVTKGTPEDGNTNN